MYIDELLSRLSDQGVGCYTGYHFAGSLCYADDVALLAPSPAALRILLAECERFAAEFNITFNAAKTQLICFSLGRKFPLPDEVFSFLGHTLNFRSSVTHLGHTFQRNLDDKDDIQRVKSDMCRKGNYLLQTFAACDPFVKTKLVVSHCLSLYGSVLWNMSNKHIVSLEAAFNNILRRIWKLPSRCHTGILHQVAGVQSLRNKIVGHFSSFLSKAVESDSPLIKHCFLSSSSLVFTSIGFNNYNKNKYVKLYHNDDLMCADYVRDICLRNIVFQSPDITKSILLSVCCD